MRDWLWEGNGSTNPCFLAVTVDLEEIEIFVAVVVVSAGLDSPWMLRILLHMDSDGAKL